MKYESDNRSAASDWSTLDTNHNLLEQLFDSDTPTLQFGHYRVIKEIDDGGSSSTVFKAKHQTTGELVALKVLDYTIGWHRAKERFDHEVAQHKRLAHPNIARVLDSGSIETPAGRRVPWLAVELVEGGRLADYIKSQQLTNRQVIELVIQICRAVGYAHKMGLVHRDLKPANICITKDGKPKLIDFGLVRDLIGESGPTLHTAQGVLIGTPAYMAPEQAIGDHAKVSPRSDVYSIGAILFELLTGVLPVPIEEGLPIPQAVTKIVNSPTRSIRKFGDGFDAKLDAIMGKALSKDASSRYESATELGEDLRAYLDKQPLTVKPPSAIKQINRGIKEHRRLVMAACVIFCFLSILALVSRVKEQRARAAEAETQAIAKQARRNLSDQFVKNAWDASDEGRNFDALVWLTEAMRQDEGDTNRLRTRRLQYASVRAMSPKLVKQEPVTKTELLIRHGDLYVEHENPQGGNSLTRVYRDGLSEPVYEFERTRACQVSAFSPNGKTLVLAFEAGKNQIGALEFIDVTNGKSLKTMEFMTSAKSVDFSADGSRLCVALWDSPGSTEGDDGYVFIIRANDYSVLRELVAPGARLTCAEWSPDESKIVTGSIDGLVHLFDAETGKIINSFQLHHQTWLTRFSPDGRHVIVSDTLSDCRVWDPITGKPSSPLIRLNGELRDAWLSGDSTQLTILTEGHRTVWDLTPDQSYLRRFAVSPDSRALRVSPDCNYAMLLTSRDGQSPFRLASINLNSGQVCEVEDSFQDIKFEWLNSSDVIVSRHTQDQTLLIDGKTGQFVREICRQPHLNESDLPYLKTFPDFQLAVIPASRSYSIYNHKSGELKHAGIVTNCTDVELSKDGRTLYFSRTGKNAAVIAVNYPELTVKWEQPMSNASRCSDVRLSQDQELVMASLPVEGCVNVFDAETGKPLADPIFSSKAWVGWTSFLGNGESAALLYGSIRQVSVHDSRTGQLRFAPLKNANSFRGGSAGSSWICIEGSKSYLMDGLTNDRLTPSYGNEICATPFQNQSFLLVEDFRNGLLIRLELVPDNRPLDDLIAEAQMYSLRKLDSTGDLLPISNPEFTSSAELGGNNSVVEQ